MDKLNKEQSEIIKMLCNSKANENNTIDLNAYAIGLNEMYCYLSHSDKDKSIADRDKRISDLEKEKWIKSKDSLPPINEPVLGFGNDNGISVRDFCQVTKQGFKMFSKVNSKLEITHWQPLPDKPKDI